jgi:hypothetical protein
VTPVIAMGTNLWLGGQISSGSAEAAEQSGGWFGKVASEGWTDTEITDTTMSAIHANMSTRTCIQTALLLLIDEPSRRACSSSGAFERDAMARRPSHAA